MRQDEIFEKLKAASFDSFDGGEDDFDPDFMDEDEDLFDPDFATGQRRVRRRPTGSGKMNQQSKKVKGGYFTITITNGYGAAGFVELFNPNQSIFLYRNTQFFPDANPFTAVNRAAANLNNVAYFDQNGNGIINNAAGAAMTISCNELPYRGLLNELSTRKVILSKLKMIYVNEAQLDNQIVVFQKSYLGQSKQNSLLPRVYFKDDQFQTKQVTLPGAFNLDPSSGLYIRLNSGETVTLNFFLAEAGCSC